MKKINLFIVLFMFFSVLAKAQVNNGNFEAGNSGFSVEGGTFNDPNVQRGYTVTTNPNSFWGWAPSMGGNGQFLVIDLPSDVNAKFWYQNVGGLQVGKNYRLKIRAASLGNANSPLVYFVINGTRVNASWAVNQTANWQNFETNWTCTSNSVELGLKGDQPTWWGNDLALDDVVMECTDCGTPPPPTPTTDRWDDAGNGDIKRCTGKVWIGGGDCTPNFAGNYALYVKTGILTERLKVGVKDSGNWADFVFDENYKLPKLSDVERFLKNKKHLPEIPSATEVVKEGLDVAEISSKLLQKIEELTLYVIEQDKRLRSVETKLNK
jgi:hypothetical protein